MDVCLSNAHTIVSMNGVFHIDAVPDKARRPHGCEIIDYYKLLRANIETWNDAKNEGVAAAAAAALQ